MKFFLSIELRSRTRKVMSFDNSPMHRRLITIKRRLVSDRRKVFSNPNQLDNIN